MCNKVAPDKRKRVSKACNTCRKHKHKCDGQQPCRNCRKRLVDCVYRPSISNDSSSNSPVSCSPPSPDLGEQSPEVAEDTDMPDISGTAASQYTRRRSTSPENLSSFRIVSTSRSEEFGKHTHSRIASNHQQGSQTIITLHLPLLRSPVFSDCYATESFVALIKQHVKLGSGSSRFTESGIWHGPQETRTASPCPSWPPDLPHLTIEKLVNSYFTNTLGFIDVISFESVEAILHKTYNGPSQVCNSDRCLIYLILAIGLVLDSSPSEKALQDPNLKERFFASAEALLQPGETQIVSKGCNGVPWTLQALVLMSFYMLCVSRQRTAHSYCARAFQVAHSFGIHLGRKTEIESPPNTEAWRVSRRNVWRSLFVLDRCLATTLGRPLTFDKHTDESLKLQKGSLLNPAVDACRIIDATVRDVYSESKTSMKNVKLLIGHLNSLADAEIGRASLMAQIRVRSFRTYANILLCRPFFLLRFIASTTERATLDNIEPQVNELSQRCVSESIRAVCMLKEGTNSTSPLNIDPFISYVLTEATYVLLCSIYADIHASEEHLELAKVAISILKGTNEPNSYAEHSASVLDLFLHDVSCRIHARNAKPRVKRRAYWTKTEPITAYDSSQYRSPFYPATQGNLAHRHDSRRRAAIEDHAAVKQESHDHPNAFASMYVPSHMDCSTSHHQSSAESPQHLWRNEHGGDMDFDRL